jgi:hypothetical protein
VERREDDAAALGKGAINMLGAVPADASAPMVGEKVLAVGPGALIEFRAKAINEGAGLDVTGRA